MLAYRSFVTFLVLQETKVSRKVLALLIEVDLSACNTLRIKAFGNV